MVVVQSMAVEKTFPLPILAPPAAALAVAAQLDSAEPMLLIQARALQPSLSHSLSLNLLVGVAAAAAAAIRHKSAALSAVLSKGAAPQQQRTTLSTEEKTRVVLGVGVGSSMLWRL
jgi:hypothetical protein